MILGAFSEGRTHEEVLRSLREDASVGLHEGRDFQGDRGRSFEVEPGRLPDRSGGRFRDVPSRGSRRSAAGRGGLGRRFLTVLLRVGVGEAVVEREVGRLAPGRWRRETISVLLLMLLLAGGSSGMGGC